LQRPDIQQLSREWAGAAVQPEGAGTRVFVEHRGFDHDEPHQQFARTVIGGGWRSHVLRRLSVDLNG